MRTNVAESPHFSFRAPEAQVWQVVVAAAVLAMLGSTSIVKAKLFRVKTVATHTHSVVSHRAGNCQSGTAMMLAGLSVRSSG